MLLICATTPFLGHSVFVSALFLAIICAELAKAGIQFRMVGIEHSPSIGSILMHMLTHNDPAHFAGNFAGLCFYACLIGYVSHRVDIRCNNALVLAGAVVSVVISILMALLIWPNDDGVAGVSGIVHFLIGYFWIGCLSIYLLNRCFKTEVSIRARLDRLFHEQPFLMPIVLATAMATLHGIFDGFDSINPFGENALGNLYHLVGLVTGVAVGFLSVRRWVQSQGP